MAKRVRKPIYEEIYRRHLRLFKEKVKVSVRAYEQNVRRLNLTLRISQFQRFRLGGIPPVSNIHHQHNQHRIADLIDDAMIPDTNPIKLLVAQSLRRAAAGQLP